MGATRRELTTFSAILPNLGEVRVRYSSTQADVIAFLRLVNEVTIDREMVVRLIHHQIDEPLLTVEQIANLPDEELRWLTKELIRRNTVVFKYYADTSDEEFFLNVRLAVTEFRNRPGEALGIPNVLRGIANTLGQFSQTINEIGERVRSVVLGWQEWLNNHKGIFEAFADFAKQYSESKREALLILKRYKWFLTPSLPITFIFAVIKIGRQPGNQRHAINRLFIYHFTSNNCENLVQMVAGWTPNSLFKGRMKIIRDCVSFLKNPVPGTNACNLILPVLIAQIDGIQTSFMKKKGFVQKVKVTTKGGKTRRKFDWEDPQGTVVRWSTAWRASVSSHQFNTIASDLANETFLVTV